MVDYFKELEKMICEDYNFLVDERSYDLYEVMCNLFLCNELDDKNKIILNNIDNGVMDVNFEE